MRPSGGREERRHRCLQDLFLAHPCEEGEAEAEDSLHGLDVAYCCDERYLAPCLVSAWSLWRNGEVDVRLHLVFRGETHLGERAVAALRELFPRGVRLYSPRQSWGRLYAPLAPGITEATMDRLSLPGLLVGVRKLLYLDSDTVVLRSLRAACALEPLGLAACAGSNAGVLLLDLSRLRREGFGERAAAMLAEAPTDDQTLLRRLYPAAGGLSPCWNDGATIRHYVGRSKPWQDGGDEIWREALRGARERMDPLLQEVSKFTPGWRDARERMDPLLQEVSKFTPGWRDAACGTDRRCGR